jgi:hypothetical protein
MRAQSFISSEVGKCVRVVRSRPGNPRSDHVAVADRLDLLDLVAVDEFVKTL